MIKINLLKGASSGQQAGGGQDFGGGGTGIFNMSSGGDIGAPSKVDLIIKLLLVVVPLISVFGQRAYTEGKAKLEISSLEKKMTGLNEEIKKIEPEIKEIEKYLDEKKRLDSQLDIIRKLSKERLKNVKSMDALQGLIPTKSWVEALKIKENKVQIDGFATDDIIVTDFMQALEASIYYANVNLVSSDEAKKESGVVKKFSIKCNLENL